MSMSVWRGNPAMLRHSGRSKSTESHPPLSSLPMFRGWMRPPSAKCPTTSSKFSRSSCTFQPHHHAFRREPQIGVVLDQIGFLTFRPTEHSADLASILPASPHPFKRKEESNGAEPEVRGTLTRGEVRRETGRVNGSPRTLRPTMQYGYNNSEGLESEFRNGVAAFMGRARVPARRGGQGVPLTPL